MKRVVEIDRSIGGKWGGGKKFIRCRSGKHFLDGQHDHTGGSNYIVGLRRAA